MTLPEFLIGLPWIIFCACLGPISDYADRADSRRRVAERRAKAEQYRLCREAAQRGDDTVLPPECVTHEDVVEWQAVWNLQFHTEAPEWKRDKWRRQGAKLAANMGRPDWLD